MLNVLIVESDPVIAMDLRDSVMARDGDARVTVHSAPLPQADRDLPAPRGFSHAFLRMSSRAHHAAGANLARRLDAYGTCVVLHGADGLPAALDGAPTVSVMPFPFTAQDVASRLVAGPDRCLPATPA